jgi:hypothetical protein
MGRSELVVYLWCCRAHGDGALIGGEQRLILRYGPSSTR